MQRCERRLSTPEGSLASRREGRGLDELALASMCSEDSDRRYVWELVA